MTRSGLHRVVIRQSCWRRPQTDALRDFKRLVSEDTRAHFFFPLKNTCVYMYLSSTPYEHDYTFQRYERLHVLIFFFFLLFVGLFSLSFPTRQTCHACVVRRDSRVGFASSRNAVVPQTIRLAKCRVKKYMAERFFLLFLLPAILSILWKFRADDCVLSVVA